MFPSLVARLDPVKFQWANFYDMCAILCESISEFLFDFWHDENNERNAGRCLGGIIVKERVDEHSRTNQVIILGFNRPLSPGNLLQGRGNMHICVSEVAGISRTPLSQT